MLHCTDRYNTHVPKIKTENMEAAPNRFSAVSVLSVHRGVTSRHTDSMVRLFWNVGPGSDTVFCHTVSVIGCSMSLRRTAYPTVPKKHIAVTRAIENTLACDPKAILATDSNESFPGRFSSSETGETILAEPTVLKIDGWGIKSSRRSMSKLHRNLYKVQNKRATCSLTQCWVYCGSHETVTRPTDVPWMRKQNSVMTATRRSMKGPSSAFPDF